MERQLTFLDSQKTTSSAKKKSHPQKKISPSSQAWHLFIDGASRGNPGPSGAGIYGLYNEVPTIKEGIYLGTKTNNQAEYLALALALFFLHKKISTAPKQKVSVTITSDSELLVRQMKGIYKVKDATLRKIKMLIESQLLDLSYTFNHVLRINNTHADELANKGIDTHKKMPKQFETLLAKHQIEL